MSLYPTAKPPTLADRCAEERHDLCWGGIDEFHVCQCICHSLNPCQSWRCARERHELREQLRRIEAELARVTAINQGDTRAKVREYGKKPEPEPEPDVRNHLRRWMGRKP